MNHNLVLEGEFVNLRTLKETDAGLTFDWRQARRAKFLNAGAATIEQQAEWIVGRPVSEYNFIIELKNGRPVGMLSLINIDKTNLHGEPGRFLIGDEQAAKGAPVAVEAMKLLYELAFDQLGLVRVHGIVAANNHLMFKWQKYLGMKEEGRLRNHLFLAGKFQDGIFVGLLAEEYRTITVPRMKVLIAAARQQLVIHKFQRTSYVR
jgi:RimJ/RimL family protein N-acetyltransferase